MEITSSRVNIRRRRRSISITITTVKSFTVSVIDSGLSSGVVAGIVVAVLLLVVAAVAVAVIYNHKKGRYTIPPGRSYISCEDEEGVLSGFKGIF
ncbi:hypothetical protein ROHU_035775 [Labeo rohita]|uniref:Uncharacterized protein n=1 Tax=Labeo rohita TaxID=84645 RepID=A0A498L5R7_LABRO|nr:hypothetical protein ROHU_035775 [Labeo rohita]